MFKPALLVFIIVALQFQYCLAGDDEPIIIQKIKPGTYGRNKEDVKLVVTGAKLMSNPSWINIQGARIEFLGPDGMKFNCAIEASDFKEGDLFRYTLAKPDQPQIETCELKVVAGLKTTNIGFTFKTAHPIIIIQKIKPGRYGRNEQDVESVVMGARLMSNPRWINLENAYTETIGLGGIQIKLEIQASHFKVGDLFRYTFVPTIDNTDVFPIETCELKVVDGFETPNIGFNYETANFTLCDENGDSMGLHGNLGAPPNQAENEFGVDMDDFPKMQAADVAMDFYGRIQQKFTSIFNKNIKGYKTIEGVFTGVSMRKNRKDKDYLVIEYGSFDSPSGSGSKWKHPLYPDEKELVVSEYEGSFEEVARKFFTLVHRKFSHKIDENNTEEVRITLVTMRKDSEGKGILVIGYDKNLTKCIV